MNLKKNVFNSMHRIFIAYGFIVKTRSSHKIEYELGDLDITLRKNTKQKTCSLWMGSNYLHQIEINTKELIASTTNETDEEDFQLDTAVHHMLSVFFSDTKKVLHKNHNIFAQLERLSDHNNKDLKED